MATKLQFLTCEIEMINDDQRCVFEQMLTMSAFLIYKVSL